MRRFPLFLILILGFVSAPVHGMTYVIRPDGTGDFPTIQAAIDACEDDDIVELTDGTFTGDGNRDIDFLGKAITVRSQSGNPEVCTIHCEGSETDPHRGFIFKDLGTATATLEGVSIKGGWGAYDQPFLTGPDAGAICCYSSDPVIRNCIFEDDVAENNGGAIWTEDSSPRIEDCWFEQNTAGEYGAALFVWRDSAYISNCDFVRNQAGQEGGGVRSIYAVLEFDECRFSENTAQRGAGIWQSSGALSLNECVFQDNSAEHYGGGIWHRYQDWYTTAPLTSCVFARNSAGLYGGAFYCGYSYEISPVHMDDCTLYENWAGMKGGAIYLWCGSIRLRQSTVYGNAAPEGAGLSCNYHHLSPVSVENSILAFNEEGDAVHCDDTGIVISLACSDLYQNAGGDWVGCIAGQNGVNGNISEDPFFCDPENGDFTLAQNSPCAPFSPPNEECDLIGAWPVGCEPVAVDGSPTSPIAIYLAPGRPNPFDASTTIQYFLPRIAEGSDVLLRIYDPAGRRVRTLLHAPRPAGIHTVKWDGTNEAGALVAGGVYFYQLKVNGETQTRRLVLAN